MWQQPLSRPLWNRTRFSLNYVLSMQSRIFGLWPNLQVVPHWWKLCLCFRPRTKPYKSLSLYFVGLYVIQEVCFYVPVIAVTWLPILKGPRQVCSLWNYSFLLVKSQIKMKWSHTKISQDNFEFWMVTSASFVFVFIFSRPFFSLSLFHIPAVHDHNLKIFIVRNFE